MGVTVTLKVAGAGEAKEHLREREVGLGRGADGDELAGDVDHSSGTQEPTAGRVDLVGDHDPGTVGAEADYGPVAINAEMLGTRQYRSARHDQVSAFRDL